MLVRGAELTIVLQCYFGIDQCARKYWSKVLISLPWNGECLEVRITLSTTFHCCGPTDTEVVHRSAQANYVPVAAMLHAQPYAQLQQVKL